MRLFIIFSFFMVLSFLLSGQPLIIELEGNVFFDSSGFSIREAGEDFPSAIETESSFFISVLYSDSWDRRGNPNKKWNIRIYRSDLNWNPELVLEAKRTGEGFVPGSNRNPNIKDGENYQPVTQTPVYFFRGMREIAAIPVMLKLSGFSITMGAVTHETNIVFTVYDDW